MNFMRKLGWTAVAALALTVSADRASALPLVSYTTEGSFDGGVTFQDVTSLTFGGTTIDYIGASVEEVNSPSNVSLGRFRLASTSVSGMADMLFGNFFLRITQTAPDAGTGSFSGVMSGQVQINSSTGTVLFSPQAVTVGSITYTFANAFRGVQGQVGLISPNVDSGAGFGVSTIEARITAPGQEDVIPEPGTYALLGGGLAGLALLHRRRMAK